MQQSDLHANGFLSTPSARRATPNAEEAKEAKEYFYPRPPRGGRPLDSWHYGDNYTISIHALREEGDTVEWAKNLGILISIHALREEGDCLRRASRSLP